MMMKTTTAPIFLTSEAATATAMEEEYNGHGLLFGPKLDFSQFLEEARKNRPSVLLHPQASSLAQLRNETQKKMPEEGKKKKKSWKTSLFSWIKVDKKSKPARGSAVSPHTSNQRPGSLSGPIYGSGRKVVQSQHVRRGASAPIANLFMPAGYEELKIPYMSLDHLNHPTDSQAYGPVYLVT